MDKLLACFFSTLIHMFIFRWMNVDINLESINECGHQSGSRGSNFRLPQNSMLILSNTIAAHHKIGYIYSFTLEDRLSVNCIRVIRILLWIWCRRLVTSLKLYCFSTVASLGCSHSNSPECTRRFRPLRIHRCNSKHHCSEYLLLDKPSRMFCMLSDTLIHMTILRLLDIFAVDPMALWMNMADNSCYSRFHNYFQSITSTEVAKTRCYTKQQTHRKQTIFQHTDFGFR